MKFSSTLSTAAISVVSFALSVKADEYEWAGAFVLNADTHYWNMEKVGGVYADPSMRMVFFDVDAADNATLIAKEAMAESLIVGNSCTVAPSGTTLSVFSADGTCYELQVGTGDQSIWELTTAGISHLLIYAEHDPVEFENTLHYLVDDQGTNIFAAAETGEGHSHTAAPSPSPADSSTSEFCFSGNMEVVVHGKGAVAMEALQVGDYVKIGNGEAYERVYAFAHRVSGRLTEFVQIHTNAGTRLEMTGEHLVFKEGNVTPVRADSIKVGDVLQAENGNTVVEKTTFVTKKGIYNPLTSSGTIQVNGITASNYISFQKENDGFVELQGGIEIPLSHHDFAHLVMAPFRFYCTYVVICNINDANSGMPAYVSNGIELVGWRKEQHIAVQLLVWASFLMIPLSLILVACAVVLLPVYLFSGSSISHLKCLGSHTKMIIFKSDEEMKKEN